MTKKETIKDGVLIDSDGDVGIGMVRRVLAEEEVKKLLQQLNL